MDPLDFRDVKGKWVTTKDSESRDMRDGMYCSRETCLFSCSIYGVERLTAGLLTSYSKRFP
jgi:hypothetical protein